MAHANDACWLMPLMAHACAVRVIAVSVILAVAIFVNVKLKV